MKEMLKELLGDIFSDERLAKKGTQRLYGLVDIGYIPPTANDQEEVAIEVKEVIQFQWKRMKRHTLHFNKRAEDGYTSQMFFAAFGEEDREILLSDFHDATQDHCAYDGPGVVSSAIGQSIDRVVNDLPEDATLRQLFAYVLVWSADKAYQCEIFVVPIDRHIRDSMQGQKGLDDYVVTY